MPQNPKPVTIEIEEPKYLDVTIYDRTLAFYEPTTAGLLDVAELGEVSEVQQAKGLFQFLLDLLSEDDAAWLDERFHDRERPISIGTLNRIVEVVMEAFIERPTLPASASTPPRKRTGRGSTGPVRSAG